MIEKRFYSEYYPCEYYTEIVDNEKELDYSLENPSKKLTINEVVDLLNEQDQKIKFLDKISAKLVRKHDNQEQIIDGLDKIIKNRDEEINGLKKENNRLNSKVNSLMDELAECYGKLGW